MTIKALQQQIKVYTQTHVATEN